jgi:anti-sigma regulatory factor (Ser/Thr protein kinase)
MNVTAAYRLIDISEVPAPRRAVHMLAERLGFDESRAGQAALIVSELGTNLVKHATRGEMLLRPISDADDDNPGIEVLAIDAGPGMSDVALSRRDGHSTAGTLGHGLGAIDRQSDFFQIYTHTSGTVMVARLWRRAPSASAPRNRYHLGAAHVSHPSEDICGDDWCARVRDERLAIMVADGLGHGLSAHEAARAASALFARMSEESPARIVEDIHTALRATRGAAIAVLAVDGTRGVAHFCGLGNISGVVLHAGGTRHSMVSQNGTAGHTAPRIHEFSYPVAPDSTIVLATDGLSTHWDLPPYPGLAARDPSIIAGVLYRDFSRRRDDVTVVVAKQHGPARY